MQICDNYSFLLILLLPYPPALPPFLLSSSSPPLPFQISESNEKKQKVEDNPLEKEEERKSCMFV